MFGVDADVAEQLTTEDRDDEPFEVLEENWPTVLFFLEVCEHWSVVPLGGIKGLDWDYVNMELEHGRFEMTPEIWSGLKIMERAGTKELNKSKEE